MSIKIDLMILPDDPEMLMSSIPFLSMIPPVFWIQTIFHQRITIAMVLFFISVTTDDR